MSRVLDFSDGFTSVSEPSSSSNYQETQLIATDLPVDSLITLPNSGVYVVGNKQLLISLNGQLLELGVDYEEFGSDNSISTQFKMLQNLVTGDRITIRK